MALSANHWKSRESKALSGFLSASWSPKRKSFDSQAADITSYDSLPVGRDESHTELWLHWLSVGPESVKLKRLFCLEHRRYKWAKSTKKSKKTINSANWLGEET